MSLVPFSPSSPVAPPSSPVPSRPAQPSARGPVGSGVARAPSVPRGDHAPSAATKGKGGFASVLAAVQDQDDAPSTAPVDGRPLAAASVPQNESTVEVQASPEPQLVTAPLPAEVPPGAQVQTPWLLLALGSGSSSWQETGDPVRTDSVADATIESVGHPVPVEASAPVEVPLMLTGAPVVAPVPVASAPAAPPELAAPAPAPSPAAAAPARSVAEPPVMGPTVVGPAGTAALAPPEAGAAESAVVVAPEAAPVPGLTGVPDPVGASSMAADDELLPADLAAPRVTESSPGAWKVLPTDEPSRDIRPPTSDTASPVPPPTMEMLTRWRAARRAATGETVSAIPPVSEVRPEATTGAAAAPSPASSRLAQWMGQQAPVEGPFLAETSTGIAAGVGGVTAAAMPASRTSEVLFRLSQAGGDRSTGADHHLPFGLAPMVVAPSGASPEITPSSMSAAAPPLAPAVGEQVMQQVVQSLKMQWKDGIGEAKLHLRPDALGAVTVTLRVEAGAVTAVVRAESAQVQEWVLQHQHTLRQQMEAAGLHLDELVVSPDDQRQQQPGQDSAPEQRRRPRVAPETDGTGTADRPRFEQLL